MLFNSAAFLIFFPLVTTAYFLLPHRFRWMLLLAASCYFYMAFIPKYILILAVTITVDYIAGLGLEKYEGRTKRWVLLASILTNIGMLAFFKYFNFANENLALLAKFIGWNYPLHKLDVREGNSSFLSDRIEYSPRRIKYLPDLWKKAP